MSPSTSEVKETIKARTLETYGQLPLYFIANQGQQDGRVTYYIQGGRHSIYFTAEEMDIALDDTTVRMRFVGAQARPPVGLDKMETKVNYFTGNDPAKWHTDIPTYGTVAYRELYPGIELRYGGQTGALKYTFVVQPGADVSQIWLAFDGATGLRLDEEGNLIILTGGDELKDTKPYAYQEISGRQVEVDVAFVLHGVNACGFSVQGNYDPHYPLVIDPTLLYSTRLDWEGFEHGRGIAVDGAGNAYVAGGGGPSGIFVAKIDTTRAGAASLVYMAYLPGEYCGSKITVDRDGNAYVTGDTSSANFPTTPNAYDDSLGGMYDAFVTKLNAAGNALLYSTYLGGSNSCRGNNTSVDVGNAIAVDETGNAYVVGGTDSADFPTRNAYDSNCNDVFITKIDTTKGGDASLVYSTYLGGSDVEHGYDIAADGAGNAYVVGQAESVDFPTSANAFQRTCPGCVGRFYYTAFVTKVDTTKSGAASLVYSTYLGGIYDNSGRGIAVDGGGNAYVTGFTKSPDFPIRNAFQGDRDYQDAFVTKIDTTRSGDASLIYSTYLGGNAMNETGYAIAVDISGKTYVVGETDSIDFPIRDPYQGTYGDNVDAFVTKIDTTQNGIASLIYSTYLGGSTFDVANGIAVDKYGNAYVTGGAASPNFPIKNAYQSTGNAFVTVLGEWRTDLSSSSKQVSPAAIVPTGTVNHTLSYTITLNNTGNLSAISVHLTDTLPISLTLTAGPVCSGGMCFYNVGRHAITWAGDVVPHDPAVITYTGLVSVPIGATDTICFVNAAQVDDGINVPFTLNGRSCANLRMVYLPLIIKNQ